MNKKIFSKLSKMQIIALGFFLIIMVGSFLLSLPIASKQGTWTNFLDCLFTATSATCVTGLVVVDTFTHWTVFGQIVILLMIQIGGLGFMSIGVLLALLLHRKIGLRERRILSESVNAFQLGGIVNLFKKILIGTLLVEGIGAALLSIRFIGMFGLGKGIYYGVFHSISAFCNAGFDLMGFQEPYCSLVNFSGDWLVNLTIVALIVIGGIGFLVWDDIIEKKYHFKKYHLHTKIVLITTLVLLVGGTCLFYLFERNNLAQNMGPGEAFLTSLFDSVTPRTAGFNTTDIAGLKDSSKLLSMILMFIGGSPGSTAGGIKTTTFVVFLLYMRSNIRRTRGINIFRRKLEDDAIKRAATIACTNMILVLIAMLIICGTQALDLRDVALETISAISTVGMSTGITRELTAVSRLAVIALMYCGRVGSLSVLISFTDRKKTSPVEYPEEKILIG